MDSENPLDVSGYNEKEVEVELAETTIETLVEVQEKDDEINIIEEEQNDSKSKKDSRSKDEDDSEEDADASTQRTLGLINFSKRL